MANKFDRKRFTVTIKDRESQSKFRHNSDSVVNAFIQTLPPMFGPCDIIDILAEMAFTTVLSEDQDESDTEALISFLRSVVDNLTKAGLQRQINGYLKAIDNGTQ